MKKLAAFAASFLACTTLVLAPASAQEEAPEAAPEDGAEAPPGTPPGEDTGEEAEPEEPVGPATEADCADSEDNDEDGDVDCDDYDCLDDQACLQEEEDEGEEDPPPSLGIGGGSDAEGETEEEPDELLDVTEEEEEDAGWEDRPLDMFELHGYMRLRADLFHMLHMHHISAGFARYEDLAGGSPYPPRPSGNVEVDCGDEDGGCRFSNNTFAGANMRFRLEPVINLGEQVRILSQIDLLDNLVLGSTPEGGYMDPVGEGRLSAWVPLRAFSTTQVPPSLQNSLTNAISVRRVWAEVTTPFGQLHFGRMGSHWGLGMMANQGNGLDDDYGDTVDRIMLATRLWGILFVPGVEFAGSGATSQLWGDQQGQAMDAGQLDDVAQYFFVVARRLPREEQEERIRRGELVLNGGIYFVFRNQVLSQERVGAYADDGAFSSQMVLRNVWALIPDVWFQLHYRGFHLEFELAYIGGDVENTMPEGYDASSGTEIRQFGGVLRGDYTALGGQLNVGLELGYASGDAELEGLTPRQAGHTLIQERGYADSGVDSLFRFDPDFNVDLILFEEVLGQVAGAMYVRPWVSYEFIRNTIGVRADIIYSVASEPVSTIGNDPNLGVEIDASIWYRAPAPHNFVAMLQYGVLFPLGAWEDSFYEGFDRVDYPQTVQAMLAVPY